MVRTVTYVNIDGGVQLVVTTVAASKDAPRVMEIAREFMSSWWVMSRG
jgi:hypothetical protein